MQASALSAVATRKKDNRRALYYSKYRYAVSIEFDTAAAAMIVAFCSDVSKANNGTDQFARLRYLLVKDDPAFASCADEFLQWIVDHAPMIKVVSGFRRLHVYASNQAQVEQLIDLLPAVLSAVVTLGYLRRHSLDQRPTQQRQVQIKEAVALHDPTREVALKNLKYAYRSYVRQRAITPEQRRDLISLFQATEDIHASPAWGWWGWRNRQAQADWPTESWYFFDHNCASTPMLVNLVVPDLIRKTLEIKKVH